MISAIFFWLKWGKLDKDRKNATSVCFVSVLIQMWIWASTRNNLSNHRGIIYRLNSVFKVLYVPHTGFSQALVHVRERKWKCSQRSAAAAAAAEWNWKTNASLSESDSAFFSPSFKKKMLLYISSILLIEDPQVINKSLQNPDRPIIGPHEPFTDLILFGGY